MRNHNVRVSICWIAILGLGLLPLLNIETCTGDQLIARFTYSPEDPKASQPVMFDASESYDPDGFIYSYTWNFGDGNTTLASVPEIIHRFSVPGEYTVNLTIRDESCSFSLTNSTAKTIHVTPSVAPPDAAFSWTPDVPMAGELVMFDASNSTPNGGEIVSYAWDFSDGAKQVEFEPYVTHVYQAFGNYTVVLNVTDSEGESSIAIHVILVVQLPVADFSFEPTAPRVCTEVSFDASASLPKGGHITSYEWNFGDGTPVEFGIIATHRLLTAGDYNVSLQVTDSEGLMDMKTITLKILHHIADLNEDDTVNILDLAIFATSFGSSPSHETWNSKADLDGNGAVNILDGVVIARSYNMCIDPFDC